MLFVDEGVTIENQSIKFLAGGLSVEILEVVKIFFLGLLPYYSGKTQFI